MKVSDFIEKIDTSFFTSEEGKQAIYDFVYDPKKPKKFTSKEKIHAYLTAEFISDALPKIKDDDETISRLLIATLSGGNNINWFLTDYLPEIVKYVPDFYENYYSPYELMRKIVLSSSRNYRLYDFFEHGFGWDDVKAFALDERNKTDGYQNYITNFYLSSYLNHIMWDEEDIKKKEQYLLEYLRVNLSDFIETKLTHEARHHFGAHKHRTGLSQSQIDTIIDMVQHKEGWDEKMDEVRSWFRVGKFSDEQEIEGFSIFQYDEDFSRLIFSLFAKGMQPIRQASPIFSNMCDFLLQLDTYNIIIKKATMEVMPYIYNSNLLEEGNKNENMSYYWSVIEEFPKFEKLFVFYALEWLDYEYHEFITEYDSRHRFKQPKYYNNFFSLLVEHYGLIKLWDMYHQVLTPERVIEEQLHGIKRPNAIYSLFINAGSKDKELETRYIDKFKPIMNSYAARWCKDEKEAQLLTDFICSGEDPERVKTLALTMDGYDLGLDEFYTPEERKILIFCALPKKYAHRFAYVFFNGKNNQYANCFIYDVKRAYSMTSLLDVVIAHPHLHKGFFHGFKDLISKEALEYLLAKGVDCVSAVIAAPNKYKVTYLNKMIGLIEDEAQALLLLELLKKSNKTIISSLIKCLNSLSPQLQQIISQELYHRLDEYSGDDEKYAIQMLSSLPLNKEQVLSLLTRIKVPYLRALLLNSVKIEFKELYQTSDGRFDLSSYLKLYYQEPSTFPLDEKMINMVKTFDGKPAGDAMKQLILIYHQYESEFPSSEAEAIVSALDGESLQEFNANILSTYGGDSLYDKNNRWLVNIPALHANGQTIKLLIPFIENYAKDSRYLFAVHIMKMIGNSGVTEAYMALDNFSRTLKKKTAKDAAVEAFENGARLRGLDRDELGDLLVEDLGFINGEIPLRYCEEDFSLLVSNDLKFVIKKPDGKITKSLPKPKAADDAKEAEKVAKSFTEQKKVLREMVKLQTHRLESAFTIWRQWTQDKWQDIFINNPVMNKLAGTLVWGCYQDDVLVKHFTVNPTPVDFDDEAIEFPANTKIGLVHYSELEQTAIDRWLEYFSDWKITPLFEQLEYSDLELKKMVDNHHLFTDFYYEFDEPNRKYAPTVLSRLRKKGWSVSELYDRGQFDALDKTVGTIGITIEFDEEFKLGSYGYESDSGDIGMKTIQFYKLNKKNVSDADQNAGSQKLTEADVPKRLVQELAREAITAFL